VEGCDRENRGLSLLGSLGMAPRRPRIWGIPRWRAAPATGVAVSQDVVETEKRPRAIPVRWSEPGLYGNDATERRVKGRSKNERWDGATLDAGNGRDARRIDRRRADRADMRPVLSCRPK